MGSSTDNSAGAEPTRLSTSNRRLLARLLRLSGRAEGVPAARFRAQHSESIDVLDQLESAGFLRRDNDFHLLTLVGLTELSSPEARSLIRDAKTIYRFICQQYRQHQSQPVLLSSIAAETGLELDRVRQVVMYMVEAPWWGGRTTDLARSDIERAYVAPSEKVLQLKTFAAVLQQLREWQQQRLAARSSLSNSISRENPAPAATSIKAAKGVATERAGGVRQSPDWIKKVPNPMRNQLREIYDAHSQNCSWLVSIGLRGVVESFAIRHVGDMQTYQQKLDALKQQHFISDVEHGMLGTVVNVGGASAHRMHTPTRENVAILLDIVEGIIRSRYILPPAAHRIGRATPKRKSRQAKARPE
jgi:hypothetical protein